MADITAGPPPKEPGGRKQRSRRKRDNGEGSIWLRTDGRYGFAAYVPTTAGTLKRVQGYARSHEEARKKLTDLLTKADQGIPVAAESWTVERYLTYWLDHVVRAERRPKTYQGYEGVVRRHLIPELGKKRLDKLSARDVRLFITRLREICPCCRNGWDAVRDEPRCCAKPVPECCGSRLSVRMVQFIHAVLRNALQTAVREEVISRNVAKLVKVTTPKYKVNRGLTVDQARDVLKAAEGERLYALYVLALCLGLRRGELFGLRWEDVHLVPCAACDGEGGDPDGEECATCGGSGIETATLEVVQTVQRIAGELRFVPPKTDDSVRTVPLPDLCITALCEHKVKQQAERNAAGKDWQDNGLVFPSRVGTPMEPDNLRRSWGRVRKSAGLEGVRFHDIRHACRCSSTWAYRHTSPATSSGTATSR
ncbi:MAG: site-specific integrase [Actinoallomurus sp.]